MGLRDSRGVAVEMLRSGSGWSRGRHALGAQEELLEDEDLAPNLRMAVTLRRDPRTLQGLL